MRLLVTLLAVAGLAGTASAQIPVDHEAVELDRSRECVDVIARVAAVDLQLAPLAERSQRLVAIAQAIALEEREVMDSLRAADPVEAEVRAWFVADGELAQRYVTQPSPALLAERTAAKDAIELRLSQELEGLQAQADQLLASTGTLSTDAGRCSGAIFVRPAVLEACQTTPSPVCDAARDTAAVQTGEFRFVESADVLWDLQELRAWSAPGPIQLSQAGQVGGARTVGLTRSGNIAITVAFGPLLRRRVDLTTGEAARMLALSDSLGFGAEHADLVFVPSVVIQATLPRPLGGESRYMVHFGEPEAADVIWFGEAGTGRPIEGVAELGPERVAKLQAGEPLMLTALRPLETGTSEALYSIELTSLNQAPATAALMRYMASQLASDLARLIPPGSA